MKTLKALSEDGVALFGLRVWLGFYSQWPGLFPAGKGFRWNWIDFTVVELGGEWIREGTFEVSVCVLGLRVWATFAREAP